MVVVGKSLNSVTMPTTTAAIVAPTSGMRSKSATSTARGSAKGIPSSDSTAKASTPATTACTMAPAT
ncbi:MAG: hypothetical protein AVDCRST_MAG69-689 [uncultured Solirubrobacteraceae bacterium]|uniref:Uncharacterized protein n=1 Tax=uncultured Solirubrobacteraceae bacterium TaxID=1162706 RepID=A0A6J4RXV6_9ACTN|nr:MAG: hypothetical protein AVDCRST_MAG69-689 [uncultured Solirubrobacteraceae bacterium]